MADVPYNPYNFKIVHKVDIHNHRTTSIQRVAAAGRLAPNITSVVGNSGSNPVLVNGQYFVGFPGTPNQVLFTHVNGPTTGYTTLSRSVILSANGVFTELQVLVPEALLPNETMIRVRLDANNQSSANFIIL